MILLVICFAVGAMLSAANAAPAPPISSTDFAPLFDTAVKRINYYRNMLGLAPLSLDSKLSEADRGHACYIVENHIVGGNYDLGSDNVLSLGYNDLPHSEAPNKTCSSSAGANVAAQGIVLRAPNLPKNATQIIDNIIAGGFDALFLLNPQATALGLGGYCAPGDCAAVASYRMGLEKDVYRNLYHGQLEWNPSLGPLPFTPAQLKKPLEFPPPGSTVPLRQYWSTFMSMLSKVCPGYSRPTGPAIVLSLGAPAGGNDFVETTDYSLTTNGGSVDACAVNAAKIEVPEQPSTKDQKVLAKWQEDTAPARAAQWTLAMLGAVMLLPRQPVEAGHTYRVSITVGSVTYKWSFNVAAETSVAGLSK